MGGRCSQPLTRSGQHALPHPGPRDAGSERALGGRTSKSVRRPSPSQEARGPLPAEVPPVAATVAGPKTSAEDAAPKPLNRRRVRAEERRSRWSRSRSSCVQPHARSGRHGGDGAPPPPRHGPGGGNADRAATGCPQWGWPAPHPGRDPTGRLRRRSPRKSFRIIEEAHYRVTECHRSAGSRPGGGVRVVAECATSPEPAGSPRSPIWEAGEHVRTGAHQLLGADVPAARTELRRRERRCVGTTPRRAGLCPHHVTNQYAAMAATDNLRLALRWLLSNPEPTYKAYFRDSYAAYTVAEDSNLRRLRSDLLHNRYSPSPAPRVYLPKASGVTRQYTLLTVTDQVVYQAAVNLVAERLLPRVRRYHHDTVFGHIPAGKDSLFFYRRWQDEYRLYSKAIVRAIKRGHPYIATFDLTAFYDSIDHHVLGYFLTQLGFDARFIDFMQTCLRKWTSTDLPGLRKPLELHHGIPQGPISSGLLSEVVLQHIDRRATQSGSGRPLKSPRYVRYVDDIRIFGTSELELQRRLVRLDYAAKEIGLFPQSAKIDIHKVTDPWDEVKTISGPPMSSGRSPVNGASAVQEVLRLTRRGTVRPQDRTRLKYLIGQIPPSHRVSQRLLSLLGRYPDLYSHVSAYFSRYPVLPGRTLRILLDHLGASEVYQAPHALILSALHANVHSRQSHLVADYCEDRLGAANGSGWAPLDTPYRAALLSWLLAESRLTHDEVNEYLKPTADWWLVKTCLPFLHANQFGPPSYTRLLQAFTHSESEDVARAAAVKMVEEGVSMPTDTTDMNTAAQLLLQVAGRLVHVRRAPSGVGQLLTRVFDVDFKKRRWARLLGSRHHHAEAIAFSAWLRFGTDPDSFVVNLDSLFDLIWESLFDRAFSGRSYGAYGSILRDGPMVRRFPRAAPALLRLHLLRLESFTAHPRSKGGAPMPRRLKHKDFEHIKSRLSHAVEEIAAFADGL